MAASNATRAVGKVSPLSPKRRKQSGTCGCPHPRWATHGVPSEEECPLHMSGGRTPSSNYQEIRDELRARASTFTAIPIPKVIARIDSHHMTTRACPHRHRPPTRRHRRRRPPRRNHRCRLVIRPHRRTFCHLRPPARHPPLHLHAGNPARILSVLGYDAPSPAESGKRQASPAKAATGMQKKSSNSHADTSKAAAHGERISCSLRRNCRQPRASRLRHRLPRGAGHEIPLRRKSRPVNTPAKYTLPPYRQTPAHHPLPICETADTTALEKSQTGRAPR